MSVVIVMKGSVDGFSVNVTGLPQLGNYSVLNETTRGYVSIPTCKVVKAGIKGATKVIV